MPIEIGYVPDGGNKEIGNYLLEPGEGLILSDFSEGEKRMLAIGCYLDDSGGKVQILPSEGCLANEAQTIYEKSNFPPHIGTIHISPHFSHQQELLDDENNIGCLNVRYVSGGKITAAGFITKSLIYPN